MFITGRRLFDGRAPEVRENWGVEVDAGRIVDVGPAPGAGADVVDLGDVTLLPGLVDVHQHLVFDASDDPVGHLRASDDAALLEQMAGAAQRALAVGITTIQDLGDRGYLALTLRDRFRHGDEVGPRIVASGPPLTVTGGHCCTFFTADGVDADPAVLDQLAGSGTTISMTGAILPGTAPPIAAMRQRLGAIRANHAALFRAGARIVCSSDAGVTATKPHDVLPHGVSGFLSAIGMTSAQALVATTAVAAEVCGVAAVAGTLEPGKDADILAVAGDPLADITAIHDVVAVYARGRQAVGPT